MKLVAHRTFHPLVWLVGFLPLAAMLAALLSNPDFTAQSPDKVIGSAIEKLIRDKQQSSISSKLLDEMQSESEPALEALQTSAAADEPKKVSYTVKSGDTLGAIWNTLTGSQEGALKAARACEEVGASCTNLRKGEVLEITLNLSGEIASLHRNLSGGKNIFVEETSPDEFVATLEESQILESEKTVSGVILSSFSESASEASIPYGVVDELVDLLSSRIEFRKEIQPGDTFSIIYTERKTADGEVLEPGHITAASIKNQGKLVAAIRNINSEGKPVYFDESGKIYGNYFLRYPLQFSRISSVFTTARFHPILQRMRPHNGVDFAAPVGTPVRAVADGIVEVAAYSGGAGNMVKLRHDSRYETAYLHLSRISNQVKKGARIHRGDIIGAVGMTGWATGPHLHFSLYDNGTYTDPLRAKLPSLGANGQSISPGYLVATLKRLEDGLNTTAVALAETHAKRRKA